VLVALFTYAFQWLCVVITRVPTVLLWQRHDEASMFEQRPEPAHGSTLCDTRHNMTSTLFAWMLQCMLMLSRMVMPDSVRTEWANVLSTLDGASSVLQTSDQHRTLLVRVSDILPFLIKGVCLLKSAVVIDSMTHLYLLDLCERVKRPIGSTATISVRAPAYMRNFLQVNKLCWWFA
jgi:hypothetical protein